MVTVFAAIVGCLIYVPQFLASVQTMEIVPSLRSVLPSVCAVL
jgi:sugar phosphate permease